MQVATLLPCREPLALLMPALNMFHAGTAPQLMAVPTHFFKVVLGEFGGARRAAVGAFVMPNAPIEPDTPLTSFAVPVSALEEVAGGCYLGGG